MNLNLADILQLGDPLLYRKCTPVKFEEINQLMPTAFAMADLVKKFKTKYGAGRAISAPQVGLLKQLIVMNIDQPIFIFNPKLENLIHEMIDIWDDCMSFPMLFVKLRRHKTCTLHFKDKNWKNCSWYLENDLSELIQHECDHLEGIIATQRAIDNRSFKSRIIVNKKAL